jgi:hypothetical protein
MAISNIYDNLVYFIVIWYILVICIFCGHLVKFGTFFLFWYVVPRKPGDPAKIGVTSKICPKNPDRPKSIVNPCVKADFQVSRFRMQRTMVNVTFPPGMQSQNNISESRVARWYNFGPKTPIWFYIGGPWNEKVCIFYGR